MSNRGEYRSIHTVLVDGPDFQTLEPDDRLTLLIVKLSLGPSGIDVVPALVPTLVERTGLDAERVGAALARLESGGWIRRERNVLWLVNGLKYEPSLDTKNKKHRTGVQRHAYGLPRLALIAAFARHYAEWFDGEDSLSIGIPESGDTLSNHRNLRPKTETERETETETETETEEGEAAATLTLASGGNADAIREAIPEPYRPDFDALIQRVSVPASLVAELEALHSGLHPPAYTWEEIGLAIHDLVLGGKHEHPNARQLRRYVEGARGQLSGQGASSNGGGARHGPREPWTLVVPGMAS